jgi:uncharacterized integral membrane protein
MKRLLVMLLVVFNAALFATSIQSIRAKDYYGSVVRFVLDMDQDTDFIVEKSSDGFYLGIPGFDGKIPAYSLGGTYLDAVYGAQGGIVVKTNENLNFYKMRLSDSKCLVVDFYKADNSKASRLALARFNTEKGRLVAADKAFSSLAVDYPNHYDVWYYWGELLIKRESSRAADKLYKIPSSSSYYEKAQKLLDSGLSPAVRDEAAPVAEEAAVEPEIEITGEPEGAIQVKSVDEILDPPEGLKPEIAQSEDAVVYTIPPELLEDADEDFDSTNSLRGYWLYILCGIILLVILIIIIILERNRRKSKDFLSGIHEGHSSMDTNTMLKMVNRLLADGWTNKEIARELKISLSEVEQSIHRLHYVGGLEEDDDKQ